MHRRVRSGVAGGWLSGVVRAKEDCVGERMNEKWGEKEKAIGAGCERDGYKLQLCATGGGSARERASEREREALRKEGVNEGGRRRDRARRRGGDRGERGGDGGGGGRGRGNATEGGRRRVQRARQI